MSRIHEALKRAEQERRSQARQEVAPQPPATEAERPPTTEATRPPTTEPIAPVSLPAPEPLQALVELSEPGIESLTFATLAGRCPQPAWKPDPRTMLFFRKENHQYDTEVFRTLRSRLYRVRDTMSLRTLLVTSTLPAEGKSFVAANLAQVIAQQRGRRALLIDADLRAPRLHTLLGAPQTPGLAEYLRGESDATSVIQKGPGEDLFCIPSGNTPGNPVELISNGRLKRLVDQVSSIFDWVILDSPPVIPVSDASLVASLCDGVLLVVRAAATPFDLAQKVRTELGNTPLVGAVLNCVGRTSSYGAEYYHYYGSKTEKRKG